MTIHDYIKAHRLEKWRTWPVVTSPPGASSQFAITGMPAFFIMADAGDFEHDEKFEIYANADHTHFVSLNTTRGLFRIVHYDMIIFYSEWKSMRPGLDYTKLQPL